MASGLTTVVVLALCVTLAPGASADSDCKSYRDEYNMYQSSQRCQLGFCCGDCHERFCCMNYAKRFSEDDQDNCDYENFNYQQSRLSMIFGIGGFVTILLIFVCCCVCPCCCLYKMCRKPRPVIATTTHTTVVTSTPQQYPQQPTAIPAQSYQGAQYPAYQPVPVQPGYGVQPMPQGYGAQPMSAPYQGLPVTAGPPPTYQEATGPCYPPQPMPYSQAAYGPGQPSYPLQPPVQPQPNAPPERPDYLAQPAYNPDYVAPPRTG